MHQNQCAIFESEKKVQEGIFHLLCRKGDKTDFYRNVNNVLVYFDKYDSLVKLKLLRSYSSDLYGRCMYVEDVCVAWRKGLRSAFSLPGLTHCDLLPHVTGMLPLKDELLCRTVRFVANYLNSENTCSIVQFVSRHVRTSYLISLNAHLYSMQHNLPLSELSSINNKACETPCILLLMIVNSILANHSVAR